MKNYNFDLEHLKSSEILVGVDEVGRGPLAGPVVSVALILDYSQRIEGLNDSKKLSEKQRLSLFEKIVKNAKKIGIGIVMQDEIDRINIYNATILSMKKALEKIEVNEKTTVLIDGLRFDYKNANILKVIKGDSKSAAIMAASIVAKVTRDSLMNYYHQKYPQYMFNKHKGYPTKAHVEKIKLFGICPLHRKTFEPIKTFMSL